MIKRVSKIFLVFLLLLQSCSGNRFKDAHDTKVFTFGLRGHDAFMFCKKNDSEFMATYLNGKYPGKICTRYRQYTCHINYYCNGDKNCEKDATWWLPIWQGTENDLVKRVEFTKEKCDKEKLRNSIQEK